MTNKSSLFQVKKVTPSVTAPGDTTVNQTFGTYWFFNFQRASNDIRQLYC